jgi:glycosyltransferase involved in cell wall biosynthesis
LDHTCGKKLTGMKSDKPTISVVICAFNEQASVGKVLGKLSQLEFVQEIITVNNGSTDKTGDILAEWKVKDPRIQIITVQRNSGLGHGLMQGIYATKGDIVVRQDADLEYDPSEIIDLVAPMINGHGNVCFGSRMLVKKAHRAQYYYNYLANVLFTFLADLLCNLNLTDVETAAKAFKGDLIRGLHFNSKGFEIEIEMLFRLRKAGAVFYEVPISYYGRTIAEGKKIRLKDAFTTLFAMVRYGVFWKLLRNRPPEQSPA